MSDKINVELDEWEILHIACHHFEVAKNLREQAEQYDRDPDELEEEAQQHFDRACELSDLVPEEDPLSPEEEKEMRKVMEVVAREEFGWEDPRLARLIIERQRKGQG